MTNRNDGGPAHPVTAGHEVYATGLSVRDYFAAAALTGLLASGPLPRTHDEIAADAHKYADAMLAERAKP